MTQKGFLLFFNFQLPTTGSRQAKSWPRSWFRTRGCQCQARQAGRTRPMGSLLPCVHACYGEWCQYHPLEVSLEQGATSPECVTVEQHTQPAPGTGGTGAWFQPEQCWATKISTWLTEIVHGFYECTLALHQTTSISADSHLKDEIDASIPTLMDRRAEI